MESSDKSSSDVDRIKDMPRKKSYLEPPTLPLSGQSRYMTPLWVFGDGEPREGSDSSQSKITPCEWLSTTQTDQLQSNIAPPPYAGFDPGANKINPQSHKIQDKIKSVLKHLRFRNSRVLLQFWSPHVVGKHQLLSTVDQPFGLGIADDEALCIYRKGSEHNVFLVVKDHEDDFSPHARVFRRGVPEWTPDLTNYNPKDFPQQECAVRCNLHGYLALPVFDSTTRSYVGVLELLMSSKLTSCAYEVQQFHMALKEAGLTTPKAFNCHSLQVNKQNVLDKIFSVLKGVCSNQGLPLAQTWAVSPPSCYVSHEKVIQKSCNSFDTRCLGKVCMSTTDLPFYVQDMGMWSFREASRKRHLEKSRGVVGSALFSRGSCFCGDVTKLDEIEYPLVHYARMNHLTSCFAVFLYSVEANHDYVLEFFLPLDLDVGKSVQNVMQTLKLKIEEASGFELGDTSSIQLVGPPTDLSLNIEPDTIPIISTATTNTNVSEMVSSDSESIVTDIAKINSANVPDHWSSKQIYPITEKLDEDDVIRDNINVVGAKNNDNVTSYPSASMQKTSETINDAGEKNNQSKQGRKRKTNSLTMEAVEQHFGKPIEQAANILGVSRSTLKRFCREHDRSSWPLPKNNKKPARARVTKLKLLQKSRSKQNLQRSSNLSFFVVVFLVVRVKRWSCSSKHHGLSGKWWICGKHRCIPCKSDPIYLATRLIVGFWRWRRKSSISHANKQITTKPKYTTNIINPYPYSYGNWSLASPIYEHASPKHTAASVSDTRFVIVKATYKNDMIKFEFSTSLGLLELENVVAQRIRLPSTKIRIKYRDEDNELILLACDADLHNLLGFSTSNCTIKLIISTADD